MAEYNLWLFDWREFDPKGVSVGVAKHTASSPFLSRTSWARVSVTHNDDRHRMQWVPGFSELENFLHKPHSIGGMIVVTG